MISILNNTSCIISLSLVKKEIKKAIPILEKKYSKKANDISFAFVTKEEMREMNSQFSKKNKTTDVLSFVYDENDKASGDIAVCLDVVNKHAQLDNRPFSKHLCEVMIHGLLHIFGQEHTYSDTSLSEMQNIHEFVMQKSKIKWRNIDVQFL
jgi:probable rRNA maturation factor